MSPTRTRRLAIGGIAGPAAFIGAWAVGGLIKDGYDPVDTAISRLAAAGAETQPLMTAGFIGFGLGVPLFAQALRHAVPGKAWVAATVTGAATLGVAATPLEASELVDRLHFVAATTGYVSLALVPLLAARHLPGRWPLVSRVAGAVTAAALVAIPLSDSTNGLAQRVGLTVTDAWIMAMAVRLLRPRH